MKTNAETWAFLFRRAQELEASFLQTVPKDSAFYQALELAEEASFTHEELEAYRKVRDEIGQAQQLMQDAFGKGEAKGKAEGVQEGLCEGLRVAIVDLCDVIGIALSREQNAFLASASATQLEALRTRIKADKTWPIA